MIHPWKRAWFIIIINANFLHTMMLSTKFVWNWLGGSKKEVENVKNITNERTDRETDIQTGRQTDTEQKWLEKLTWVQLKWIKEKTVPEAFYVPIFPCVHRPLTMSS